MINGCRYYFIILVQIHVPISKISNSIVIGADARKHLFFLVLETMAEKPTYDELVQHIRALELNAADRLQAERQLRKSEQLYRRLFENAAFFISVFDENGRCLMMNQKMAHLHGGHPEDYQGKSVEELYPESHAEFKKAPVTGTRPRTGQDFRGAGAISGWLPMAALDGSSCF